jgi:hypothetical protein
MIGQSGALKERSLGVELFRLPTDFDPGQHTIVRVTANEFLAGSKLRDGVTIPINS